MRADGRSGAAKSAGRVARFIRRSPAHAGAGLRTSVFLSLLVSVIATGCGRAVSSPDTKPTSLASIKSPLAPASVTTLASVLQAAYVHGDWSTVRAQFANGSLGVSLVSRMQTWKAQEVSGLNVSVADAQRIGNGRYEVTLRFGADARAVPDYEFFICSTTGKVARVLGSAATVAGSTYLRAQWTVTRTSHFIVYHTRYQLAGTDRSYLSDLEHQRTLFAQRFKVRLPPLADYYLYPTQSEMRRLTGKACGAQPGEIGCTSPFTDPPTIQTTIGATYHEPIHVYELALVPPPTSKFHYVAPLFIGEGTAVALEDRELDPRLSDYCSDLAYAPLDDCARNAIRNVDPLTVLSDKGFNRSDAGDAYALGGSFVKYLILHGGYQRFGRFYYRLAGRPSDTLADYDYASRTVYGKTTRALLSQWKRSLCGSEC